MLPLIALLGLTYLILTITGREHDPGIHETPLTGVKTYPEPAKRFPPTEEAWLRPVAPAEAARFTSWDWRKDGRLAPCIDCPTCPKEVAA